MEAFSESVVTRIVLVRSEHQEQYVVEHTVCLLLASLPVVKKYCITLILNVIWAAVASRELIKL